jgi:hypothetical protein
LYADFRHSGEEFFGRVIGSAYHRDVTGVNEAGAELDLSDEGVSVGGIEEGLPIESDEWVYIIPKDPGGRDLGEGPLPPLILALQNRETAAQGVAAVGFTRIGVIPKG